MKVNIGANSGRDTRLFCVKKLKKGTDGAHVFLSTKNATISIAMYGDKTVTVMHYDRGVEYRLYQGPVNRDSDITEHCKFCDAGLVTISNYCPDCGVKFEKEQ